MLAARSVKGMSRTSNQACPRAADTPAAPRSPLRWLPGWLRPCRAGGPGRPGLPGHRPRPVPTVLVALRDSSRVLIRPVRRADAAFLHAERQHHGVTAESRRAGRALEIVGHHDAGTARLRDMDMAVDATGQH